MKAVIMAGGQGTRLRPLTSNQPKPMLPIVNKPIMEHIIGLLRRHEITETIATIQFLGSIIRSYFGTGEDLGVQISYATEETPLGTAGSVKNAEAQLRDDTFIVISGDALTDIDLTKLVRFHKEKGSLATICLKAVENPLEFGIVITREDGTIERFLEKPNWGQVFSDTINTGIYVLEPEIFKYIPENTVVDFAHDVFPLLLDKGLPMHGYVADGYWCDVGQFETYMKAQWDVLDGQVEVQIPGFRLDEGIWVGEGAEIDPEARVDGPAVIGENCRIEAGARLREYTILGGNVVVKDGAFLHRALIHDHAYVGPSTNLRGCVVGRNTDVRRGAHIEDGAIVGDDCSIGENAVVNPGVRIYPFKQVEPSAQITKSIIWESRGVRTLFGNEGVYGLINVDVTAEVAVRLAESFASTVKKGQIVATARDATRPARALKRATMAGLNMAGVHCHDLEMVPVPVVRHYVRRRRCAGGILLRTAPYDPQSIRATFIGSDGTNLDEGAQRKVERTYYREEFRHAYAGEVGELRYPSRALEYYIEDLLSTVDVAAVRAAGVKVVVDYGFGTSSSVLPTILARLGCDVLGVNAGADEDRSIMSRSQRHQHLRRIADLVSSSGSDLGAVMDPTAERIYLVDDRGRVIDAITLLQLVVSLLSDRRRGGKMVFPVSSSRQIARTAMAGGFEVIWAKTSTGELMRAASEPGVVFAGSPEAGLLFPEFLPASDGIYTLVKLLEFRAGGPELSKTVSRLPQVHLVHETIPCPWELKGVVMRRITEHASGDRVELVDGVKTYIGDDWALVLPDPEQPFVHIWAEGSSESSARTLAGNQTRLVRTLVE